MPPRDSRLCPKLDRAMPADREDSTRVADQPGPWLMEFGSGEWRSVRVRAWGQDRLGRKVVDVEWYIEGSAWTESYVADPARMHEIDLVLP